MLTRSDEKEVFEAFSHRCLSRDPEGIQTISLQSSKQSAHLRIKAGCLNAPLEHLQDFQTDYMTVTSFLDFTVLSVSEE